jgi:hypothetical protein
MLLEHMQYVSVHKGQQDPAPVVALVSPRVGQGGLQLRLGHGQTLENAVHLTNETCLLINTVASRHMAAAHGRRPTVI